MDGLDAKIVALSVHISVDLRVNGLVHFGYSHDVVPMFSEQTPLQWLSEIVGDQLLGWHVCYGSDHFVV